MAKETIKTGQVVKWSGIYRTGRTKTPEIALSKGDRVPPVDGKRTTVILVRATKRGK
jgi:hypothetical protein